MPYFVYHIVPDKKLELQRRCETYREAKTLVVELRKAHPDEDINSYRLVFADDEQKARILLTTKRQPSPVEEWEV